MKIGPGARVTLHFSLADREGVALTSTFGEQPVTVEMGTGQLSEGVELALYGLQAGQRQTLTLTRQQAFGERDEARVQRLPRSDFPPGMELKRGLVIAFETAEGDELGGIVSDWDEKWVTVDFNHPLAGQEVVFTAEILAVEPGPAIPGEA
ncbi:MAG TPA: peptidylprolyl isomerase [Sedimenticola sp.]|nr:peptidylprolyl isomerase [Sedimenticola sp.]